MHELLKELGNSESSHVPGGLVKTITLGVAITLSALRDGSISLLVDRAGDVVRFGLTPDDADHLAGELRRAARDAREQGPG